MFPRYIFKTYILASNAKTDLFRYTGTTIVTYSEIYNLNSSNSLFSRLQFCTLLVAIFLLEIIGGVMGYVMRAQVADVAREKMMDTMPKYNDSREIQVIWDNLQKNVPRN